jgi:hypothetical protein
MKRLVIVLALLAMGPGIQASTNGRRNTAIGLGAITIYELATGKTTNGVIAGAGTYYAYEAYKNSRNKGRRRRVRHNYIYVAPPGWHHGLKRGWRGGSVPPGLSSERHSPGRHR